MTFDSIIGAVEAKKELFAGKKGIYFLKTLMGGAFISLFTFFSFGMAFAAYKFDPRLALPAVALTFGVSLVMIIMTGSELFTSNCFSLPVGLYGKKITLREVLKIGGVCYLGNFAAIFVIVSGFCLTKSYPEGFGEFVAFILAPRYGCNAAQLVYKGVMCNFAVCTGTYISFKLKSEAAKIILIYISVAAFVISGFEHSIANMAAFSLGFWLEPGFDVLSAVGSLLTVTLGNIVGGAFLLGLPVYFIEKYNFKRHF